MRTITGLKKAFGDFSKEKGKELKKEIGYIDVANVCMFIPKRNNLKKVLERAEDFNEHEREIPDLINENSQTCGFSTEYLEILLLVLKKLKLDRVKLTIAKDYPMVAETKEFKFILAPNVKED